MSVRSARGSHCAVTRLARIGLIVVWCTLVSLAPALAGDGIGTISLQSRTDTTLTITWTLPSYKYQICNSVDIHKVCWKEAGSSQDTCKLPWTYTNSPTLTIGGLSPSTKYKIKVYTKASKNNKNCKYRRVDGVKYETNPTGPPPPTHALKLDSLGNTDMIVIAEWSQPQNLSFVRACYKQAGYPVDLESNCKKAPAPFGGDAPDEHKGYGQENFPMTAQSFPFDGLKNCDKYKVVAYAFDSTAPNANPGDPNPNPSWIGDFIGELKEQTGSGCESLWDKIFSIFMWNDLSTNDSDGIAKRYLIDADALYTGGDGSPTLNSLVAHLGTYDPEIPADANVALLDGDPFYDDATLAEYLLYRKPDALDAWQGDPALVSSNMTLLAWMQTNEPIRLQEIYDEWSGTKRVPALSTLGLGVLLLCLAILGSAVLLRRRIGVRRSAG